MKTLRNVNAGDILHTGTNQRLTNGAMHPFPAFSVRILWFHWPMLWMYQKLSMSKYTERTLLPPISTISLHEVELSVSAKVIAFVMFGEYFCDILSM